jgi:nucleoside-diphosphate-sugar epimerase
MRVFIQGVNGFIGNALVRAIMNDTDWKVSGIDVERDRLARDLLANDRFEFHHGDLSISKEWVEFQIKRSDVVVPLAAVAIPKIYVENPLLVFELDFLANLRVVQLCAQYRKRLVFPSTSEVYGMCPEEVFDEELSNLVLGPICKHRWIYSSAKQLLDRVIHAYGLQQDFHYTIFRPFNWIGPHLDRIDERKIGNSRVVTQFISSVVHNEPIHIVDGGAQRRCILYLDDGIDALMRILRNEGNKADRRILNLGNPANDVSIAELARAILEAYEQHPRSKKHPFTAGVLEVRGEKYYGEGYQDIASRRPSIARAREVLGWEPRTPIREAIRLTMESFLSELPS